jgi:hypothetical protein
MSGKPMMQQQQQLSQPAPPQPQAPTAAAVREDSPGAKKTRSPSPPNKGAPTFNGRNWL